MNFLKLSLVAIAISVGSLLFIGGCVTTGGGSWDCWQKSSQKCWNEAFNGTTLDYAALQACQEAACG